MKTTDEEPYHGGFPPDPAPDAKISGTGHPRFYELLQRMAEVHSAKNRDYAGDKDPLRNLRQCADAGVDPWVGVVVRLTDKMDRLKSFAKARSFAVKDEGIADTLIDAANYALLCLILFEEQQAALEQERTNQSWADAALLDELVEATEHLMARHWWGGQDHETVGP